jgi:hypothetical protein
VLGLPLRQRRDHHAVLRRVAYHGEPSHSAAVWEIANEPSQRRLHGSTAPLAALAALGDPRGQGRLKELVPNITSRDL